MLVCLPDLVLWPNVKSMLWASGFDDIWDNFVCVFLWCTCVPTDVSSGNSIMSVIMPISVCSDFGGICVPRGVFLGMVFGPFGN